MIAGKPDLGWFCLGAAVLLVAWQPAVSGGCADGMQELSFFNSVIHHSIEDDRRFTEDTAKTSKWCNI